MTQNESKLCTKCNQLKPRTSFYRDTRATDGLMSQCGECNRSYSVKSVGKHAHLKDIPQEPEGSRWCTECQTMKTIDEFELYKKGRFRRRICQICRRKQNKKYASEHKEQRAEYRTNNPETIKKGYVAFHSRNPNYASERNRKRRAENPEVVKDEVRRSKEKNRDKYLIINAIKSSRRRAMVRGFPNTLTVQEWRNCLVYFNHRCVVCNGDDKIVCDHWIPISNPNCPGTVASNCVPLCQLCNSSKFNYPASIWLREKFTEAQAQAIEDRVAEYFRQLG